MKTKSTIPYHAYLAIARTQHYNITIFSVLFMNKKISNNPFQIQRLMTDDWSLVILSHDSKVCLSPKWSGVKGLASGYPFSRACNAIYDSEQVAGSFYVINQVKTPQQLSRIQTEWETFVTEVLFCNPKLLFSWRTEQARHLFSN